MKIAYFGTGLLGSGFVRAMLERGNEVRVWNRTHAKARKLDADGAIVCDQPDEALHGAAALHLTLADDASRVGTRAGSPSRMRRCSWDRRTRAMRAAS